MLWRMCWLDPGHHVPIDFWDQFQVVGDLMPYPHSGITGTPPDSPYVVLTEAKNGLMSMTQ